MGGSGGSNCNSASFIQSAASACSFPGRCTLSFNGQGCGAGGVPRGQGSRSGGPPIHSRARTRSVVIRVPTRMINEAFWGLGKFLFCWGPMIGGQGLGAFARCWKGVDLGVGVVPYLLACMPSRSSHYSGIFPSELGFQRLD